jgi:hypothetical protein
MKTGITGMNAQNAGVSFGAIGGELFVNFAGGISKCGLLITGIGLLY